MILGTKARYAVMAMVELASREEEKPVTLADLAEKQEIPLPYLEQIFAKLRRGGLVRSVRGPGGGYTLSQARTKITIADIITAVDESLKMTRCEATESTGCMSSKTRCATHDLWEGLSSQIYAYLKNVSLDDVCSRNLNKSNACTGDEFFIQESEILSTN